MSDFHDHVGNLRPAGETITLYDLLSACEQTHNLTDPVPPGLEAEDMRQIVKITSQANEAFDRNMTYGPTLSWGITIGVLAERMRLARLPGEGR